MDNPLLAFEGLPPFSRIEPRHVEPALEHLIAENRALCAALLDAGPPYSWKSLVEPLEVADDRLNRAWSPVSHRNSVDNSDELRKAYNACLPKLSQYATEMGQNERLFRAYRAVADTSAALDQGQRKVLENALRDFHLSGVDLEPAKKGRFKEISQRLSELASRFAENVLDATHAWTKLFTEVEALAGLPESALDLARQAAEQRGETGWMLTLDAPSYLPVMNYADDRALRREVYEAYATRASDQGPHGGRWDNGPLIEEILALRHEQAQLLGFDSFAEQSLAKKMARSTGEVMTFLEDLAARSRGQARREYDELEAFAQQEFGVGKLEIWDVGYYSEKLRQHKYAITQEALKPYFPETRVIPGLFSVVERLFGMEIREVSGVDSWHPDVRFFEIRDNRGQLRGQFYLDLYARPGKRGGAWMDECVGRMFNDQWDQIPVAYLTCNFSPPVGGKPALLTHNEVLTLFHEFGHGLHHMLTRVDYPAIAGIRGVAWDAVELPSQFLENWCWEQEALGLISGHHETGAPLPDDLFRKMQSAKNFQSGMAMARQLEFALFDFRIHREYDPERGGRVREILDEVRKQVAVVERPAFERFPHGFTHIFGGGYAAGYYSYKWAEVLSADAFSLFEERGIFDDATGSEFLCNILERGGERDAMELYVAFRGRGPRVDALLRRSGIAG